MKYIEDNNKPGGCIFCEALKLKDSPENLIVLRAEYSFVILNRYPYTNGHLMVVPYAHQPTIEALDRPTRSEMMELVNRGLQVLRAEYNAQAFNIGVNIGAAAGAGVAEHVHIHVVPRWAGDTNFMSTVGEIRVLPEELAETYRRLSSHWEP